MKSIDSSILTELFSEFFAGRCPPALAGGCSKQRSARCSHTARKTSGASPAEPRGTGHCHMPPQAAIPKPLVSSVPHPASQHLHLSLSGRAAAQRQWPGKHKTAVEVSLAITAALHSTMQPALPWQAAKDFSLSVSNHCAIRCKMHWLRLI